MPLPPASVLGVEIFTAEGKQSRAAMYQSRHFMHHSSQTGPNTFLRHNRPGAGDSPG